MKTYSLLSILLLVVQFAAFSQKIETSPDQGETPSIVPKGHIQFENRFIHEKTNNGNSRKLSIPETNCKWGINDNVEFQIVTQLTNYKAADSSASGLEPVKTGFKVKLWNGKNLLPDVSLSALMQLPNVASTNFKTDYLAPEIALLFHNKVTEQIDIVYNLGAEWDGNSRAPQFMYTLSPKLKLGDKFETFLEAYGFFSQDDHPEHWLDTGLEYFLTDNIQLEIAVSYQYTSTDNFRNFHELLGIAFRI